MPADGRPRFSGGTAWVGSSFRRREFTLLRIAVVVAAALAALSVIEPASGATACATRVLRDWSDDGHVASRYSPPCYEEAIDALPTDLRDYTNAQDVIARALTQAVRSSDGESAAPQAAPSPRVSGSDRSLPLGLVAVAAAAAVLLCAGASGYALRRARSDAEV